MMTQAISPISIDSIHLTAISFSLDPSGPQEGAVIGATMNIEHSIAKFGKDVEGSAYQMDLALSLNVSLHDDGNQDEPILEASARYQVQLSCASDIAPEEEIAYWLEVNGVSLAYSQARAQIMALASVSPAGQFVLPPLNIEDYVREIKASAE